MSINLDKQADLELMNWARSMNDSWLRDNLLCSIPHTSEDYRAPTNAFDDPEPATEPIDELAARVTEGIIVQIGLRHFDSYRALVHWYPRLMMLRRDGESITQGAALKRLSKHMHTSILRSRWLLEFAVKFYTELRWAKKAELQPSKNCA